MQKITTLLLAVFFILSFTTAVLAADKGATTKLERGSKNMALGWSEIPKSIVETSKQHNALVGITIGTIKGIGQAFARTLSGAVDVVTFPVGAFDKPAIQPYMNMAAKPAAPAPVVPAPATK